MRYGTASVSLMSCTKQACWWTLNVCFTASSSQGYDENVCNMVAEEQECNEDMGA